MRTHTIVLSLPFLLFSFLLFCPTAKAENPTNGGYSVPYLVEGILTVHEDGVTLNTDDGRVFSLVMNAGTAKKFADRNVKVDGLAQQCDKLAYLKVRKIDLYDKKAPQIVLPPFKQGQRPPTLVTSTQNSITVKDFRWDLNKDAAGKQIHSWETVTIKPDLVKGVYFIKKPFPPEWIAAHSLLLYTFQPGGVVDSKGRDAGGFILTIEAYQRTNQNFDLMKGMKNQFAIVWILGAWNNYLRQACQFQNEKLFLYPVQMTHQQKAALVRESIDQALVNREGEYYHTITNNCTNNLVVLFNRVLDKAHQVKMWAIPSFIYNFKATMPVWVPPYLIKKGLLGRSLPELNQSTYQSRWAEVPDEYKP